MSDTVLGAEIARLYTLRNTVVRLPHLDSTNPREGHLQLRVPVVEANIGRTDWNVGCGGAGGGLG